MNQGPYGGPPSQQGYGPPGYPPQQQGYPGYPQQPGYPQGPPPKKGLGTGAIVAIVLGGIFVLFGGSCLVCVVVGARSAAEASAVPTAPGATPTGTRQQAMVIDINTLLGDYKANEVRADGTYKDHFVQTTGKVSEIKKDIVDDMYVTLGTGKQFEIPEVQCTLKEANKAKAAALSKGQVVTVRGKVNGLLMNVQLGDCDIL